MERIKEVRELICKQKIDLLSYDFYKQLLEIERMLWDLAYFVEKEEERWFEDV